MRKYQIIIDDIICRWGYSKQYIRRELDQYAGKHVDMCISSLGGDLDHGLDIREQLLNHGDVTVYLTGFVASAATIIAMGAKRVLMSKYAMFLVHKCSNFIDAWGNYNADEMQQLINELEANKKENDRIDVVIAQLYSKKTGKSINDLLEILKEGRWLTAQEALDYGFVDELFDDAGDSKQNLTPALMSKLNAFGITTNGINPSVTDEEGNTRSMLRQILDHISGLFAAKSNDAAAEQQPGSESPQILTHMDSTYTDLMSVLAVSALSLNADGSATLTAEQLRALNDRLASLNTTVAERDNTISDLTTQVENLKNLPGDDTKENLDDTGKSVLSEDEMYNLANSFLE